ncbi:PLP-dependent aminotransferase family protein [Xylanimonas allomyrinae]|uniref:PLP-dependent aminotransferase family protein n=1 Tax=Xylanimonas allomyrinae TaxID=2509459 RepID=A0A4P6ESC8_9MICO|nr:PLP-dependent aminotransferase family protein [Xylanimonas allomyrinae]QAY63307.1 PLP-dependent aminotransferase family protein [Xylanimonas allomyrinae]
MVRRRATAALRLALDPAVHPATERVVRGVVRALHDGQLQDGDPMPSSRVLADSTGIARSSVVAAYERLAGMGVLAAVQGRATVVRSGARLLVRPAAPPTPAPVARRPAPPCVDLSVPGGATPETLDAQDWNRAWRRAVAPLTGGGWLDERASPRTTASTREHPRRPGSGPACADPSAMHGTDELRHALVDFLRTTRGIVASPEDLVLRPSLSAAVADVVDGFELSGREVVIEDPSLPGLQRRLALAGCRVRSVPVDDEGLRVDLLGHDVAAVHVTPARQWPTGAPLSPRRRDALLAWSRRTGGVVIENDHDAVFTFGAAPPVPLAAQAQGGDDRARVAFLGSSAKLVATDLQVVWLVAPQRTARRDDAVAPVCGYTARALADYLTSGALYRHHNRTLRLVEDRRDALVAALASHAPAVRVRGDACGTEAVIDLPAGIDEWCVRRSVQDAGFRCSTLGDFAVREQRAALVVHYGPLPAASARRFAAALAAALGPAAR